MLTEDRIADRNGAPAFFNPGSLNSWRELPIFTARWRYKWEGDAVEVQDEEGNEFSIPTWNILEVSEDDFRTWSDEPSGLVVTAKDVADYVKENILKKEMARRIAGQYR